MIYIFRLISTIIDGRRVHNNLGEHCCGATGSDVHQVKGHTHSFHMNSQELRAKLLARRAAQRDSAEKRAHAHEEAKEATKVMILLGYNFDDILDLATPKVSEDYLTDIFHSVGYHRKRKRWSQRLSAFGAPRWLESPEDMVIDLLDSESEDDVEARNGFKQSRLRSSFDDKSQPLLVSKSEELREPEEDRESEENQKLEDGVKESQSPVSPEELQGSKEQHQFPESNETMRSEVPAVSTPGESANVQMDSGDFGKTHKVAEPENYNVAINVEIPTNYEVDNNHPGKSNVEMNETSAETDQSHRSGVLPDAPLNELEGSVEPEQAIDANKEDTGDPIEELVEEPEIAENHPEDAKQEEMDVDSSTPEMRSELVRDVPVDGEELDVESQVEEASHVPAGDSSEDVIREETERVKAQIEEIRSRQAKLVQQKRNSKLRDIVLRRTQLTQARQSVNMASAANKVARLESQLVEAKALMIQAAQRIKEIEKASDDLDREELAIVGDSPQDGGTTTDDNQESIKESDEPIEPKKPLYVPQTVEQSPLRMFSSFRMCPSLKPRYWFAPTYNSRFVRDLNDRVMCNTELKRGVCRRKECKDIHFYEFEVPGSIICQYMASREIDDLEFRDGLINAVETHLKSNETPVENLAATIIGYRRKCHPSQFLDWSGPVKRPF